MAGSSLGILVFSEDRDFFRNTGSMLSEIGITHGVRYTGSETELVEYFNSAACQKLIIYDSLYGSPGVREKIWENIIRSETVCCIYMRERRDSDIFDAHIRIIGLDRPYTLADFSDAMNRLGFGENFLFEILPEANRVMNNNRDIESAVSSILHELGIPPNIKGSIYLRYAITMVARNPEMIRLITKNLYIRIARKYSSTPACVERAVRHAIDRAWDTGDIISLNTYFGSIVSAKRGRPTNSEFISVLADVIRRRLYVSDYGIIDSESTQTNRNHSDK